MTAAASACTAGLPFRASGASMHQGPTPALGVEDITSHTIAETEKVLGIRFTSGERGQIAATVGQQLKWYHMRSRASLPNSLSPASTFTPLLPGYAPSIATPDGEPALLDPDPGSLPGTEEDIAYSPLSILAGWIRNGALSSRRLTDIYLSRLQRVDPLLNCVITLTPEHARRQAAIADKELARGRYRGPLHGIPWGAKDLLDTAGIPTTWGAGPYRDQVPDTDASVVRRLDAAGAVMVAKLSLGALAYGDIWFGGRTNNPWDTTQGSSGSSAGPAAATAAGLVGFSIGSETLGSIVSPCMACGTTGLRPTFGRISRTGAMALSWSLDKIGPICRSVQDTALVLSVLNGGDTDDAGSVDMPFTWDPGQTARGIRLGYDPAWFDGDTASEADRDALEAARDAGCLLQHISLPDWPYESLLTLLMADCAAAFENLTRSGQDDDLSWQDPEAWPNSFRTAWCIPAIEYVQAQRFRRQVMHMMAGLFEDIDAMIAPSFAGSLLTISNFTGHPCLVFRSGFSADGMPRGTSLVGRLYDEGTLCRVGSAIEMRLDVAGRRPDIDS